MKIMICLENPDRSTKTIQLAITHAKAFGASIEVVTIGSPENKVAQVETMEENLEKAQGIFESEMIPCKTHLLIHNLSRGEDLVQFASENNIDQIMLGIKKTSRVGKFLLGSTARYVILNATCPVVSIK